MNKLYTRIDWENNTTPALNETNLNLMSKGIDDIDDRVVYLANEIIGDTPVKMNVDGSNADSEVTFSGAFTVGSRSGSVGTSSVAEGNSVEASGSYSHAEGDSTTASGGYSHAEGANTTASGYLSHAEGESTTASKNYSHAEGIYTTASGSGSHAEGIYATASGTHSHAEGNSTKALGDYSHAEGNGTKASGIQQHVQGKFNIEDLNNTYADIVGGGTGNNNRANIETLDWSGNLTVAGNMTDGSGNVLSAKLDSDDIGTLASADIESGIASFKSYIKKPVSDLVIGIEPVQSGSGDPSPSNVRPISGHTEMDVKNVGKNLWSVGDVDKEAESYKLLSLPINTYTISSNISKDITFRFNYIDGSSLLVVNVNANEPRTFTTTDKVVSVNWSYTNFVSGDIAKIQLEVGSTATNYEPYAGTEYTIDLNGTIYGGSLNVTTGELTVDRAIVDLGTLTWTRITTSIFRANLSGIKVVGDSETSNLVCSQYVPGYYAGLGDKQIATRSGSQLWVRDSTYDNVSTFQSAMNGVQLVYELATPTTVQLTAQEIITLLGTNNIFADTGDVESCYYERLSESNDSKAEISALGTEQTSTVATKPYAVNDLFYMNGKIYKVTTAIAQGANITIGTNCTETTVLAVLTALLNA